MSDHSPIASADNEARRVKRRYRKFCVVVDGSAESKAAIRFAAGRAAHTVGGRVTLFCVVEPQTESHWVAVKEKMEEEARDAVEQIAAKTADAIFEYVGLRSEVVMLEGQLQDMLQQHLAEDDTLFALILGAAPGNAPGALVDFFSGDVAGTLPCPVVIVPGALDPSRIDEIV
ncbi:MAG: universal stress protein [Pseudomonadota bacterium]